MLCFLLQVSCSVCRVLCLMPHVPCVLFRVSFFLSRMTCGVCRTLDPRRPMGAVTPLMTQPMTLLLNVIGQIASNAFQASAI